jgi:putative transposase
MLDRSDRSVSIRRQCRLVGVARSGVYRPERPVEDPDAVPMRLIDELYTSWPFLGSRRMASMLRSRGLLINRKRV